MTAASVRPSPHKYVQRHRCWSRKWQAPLFVHARGELLTLRLLHCCRWLAATGTDGNLWKYWGDAVRADGEQGGAAARLLAAGASAGEFEWEVVEGPDWQGPIWVKKQPASPKL